MKKEIEVWVPAITAGPFAKAEMLTNRTRDMMGDGWLKAKLIIELPERKVTISEAEFDEAFELARIPAASFDNISAVMKEKIFGKESP